MISAADQYRALVAKLESINPSGPVVEAPEPQAEVPAAAPAEAPAPNIEQQIMNAPTFNKAYAMAKKAGLKTFKYCRTYAVKDAPVKQDGMANPQGVQFTGQPSNLATPSGMDFSPISGFGA